MKFKRYRTLLALITLCFISVGGFADTLITNQDMPSQSVLQPSDILGAEQDTQLIISFSKDVQIGFQGQCSVDDDCGTGWKCCNTSCENVDVCYSYY